MLGRVCVCARVCPGCLWRQKAGRDEPLKRSKSEIQKLRVRVRVSLVSCLCWSLRRGCFHVMYAPLSLACVFLVFASISMLCVSGVSGVSCVPSVSHLCLVCLLCYICVCVSLGCVSCVPLLSPSLMCVFLVCQARTCACVCVSVSVRCLCVVLWLCVFVVLLLPPHPPTHASCSGLSQLIFPPAPSLRGAKTRPRPRHGSSLLPGARPEAGPSSSLRSAAWK